MISAAVAERPAHVPEDRVVDFDMFAPPGGKHDIFGAWKTLQQPGAPEVIWTPRNGGHWIATRGKQINEVSSDAKRFSSHIYLLPRETGEQFAAMPLSLNPPQHAQFRALYNPGLNPNAVKELEQMIRQIAIELIEAVRLQGACEFTTDYAEMFPLKIFMLLVDLPFSEAPEMKRYVDELLRPSGEISAEEGSRTIAAYLSKHVAERMGSGRTDMLSQIINGTVKGRPVTAEEALSLSMALLAAGLDTVANFSSFAMLFLARNPEYRKELIADPSLIPNAVEELLRRHPVAMGARVVRNDIDFYGAPLKKDDMILAPGPLVGLDDRLTECPMDVDFKREKIKHSTFGYGNHHCAGSHLARLEMRVTLEEWLVRIPEFEIAPDTDITYTGGHVVVIDRLPLKWKPAVDFCAGND